MKGWECGLDQPNDDEKGTVLVALVVDTSSNVNGGFEDDYGTTARMAASEIWFHTNSSGSEEEAVEDSDDSSR